jgi:hypothetical protein
MALKNPIQPKTSALLDALKAWCTEEKGRQTLVAREIGTNRHTVNKWFSGNQAPTSEQILSVQEFLKRVQRRKRKKKN